MLRVSESVRDIPHTLQKFPHVNEIVRVAGEDILPLTWAGPFQLATLLQVTRMNRIKTLKQIADENVPRMGDGRGWWNTRLLGVLGCRGAIRHIRLPICLPFIPPFNHSNDDKNRWGWGGGLSLGNRHRAFSSPGS